MRLTLPWPPTVNTYWRHVGPKVLISEGGRKYRRQIRGTIQAHQLEQVRPYDLPTSRRLSVSLLACPPDRRRRDLDNILKALLDALQHAGVYEDDSQIDSLQVDRCPPIPGGQVNCNILEIRRNAAGGRDGYRDITLGGSQ